ncbi:UNVERIFIED_CONTAM: hypothetical protein Slati_2459400 [Sesamum latifolium]|uniref:Reverse transcriptase domain-containing protein n=1 Tax=Sesamum latifolium TaxID=2727402 RepID=A0AAW2WDD6_9LAMI
MWREHLGFGSIRVRSFRLPSPGLSLEHGIGRRFPSWTRQLCLVLEIMLCRVARHRNLLSYSGNDCGHSFIIAQHISKCIGDTTVMIQPSFARDCHDSSSPRTTPVLSEPGIQIIPTKPPRLPYDDPCESPILTPSKSPLKGFVSSTQEEEGGNEELAIDEKGFDPKAFKLLVKARYNPKKKLSLGKLPPETTSKKLHGLNATQVMLKEKGHAIQDSRVGLFTPPMPVRIAVRRTRSHKRALHGIANKQSVFDRLGPCKRMGYQKKCVFKVAAHSKKNTKSSPTQKLRSLIPSKMRNQTTLAIPCGKVLKVKAQTMIFTQVQSDDEDDRESVASSNYITNVAEEDIAQTYHVTLIEDGEVEEEEAEDAPVELEEAEVNKLIEVGFIREVKYPKWISSIVPVRKKNGQIRVCVDFRDLNNAYPKDDLLLPIAERMIDSTTGHEALSFMDGSSGYN